MVRRIPRPKGLAKPKSATKPKKPRLDLRISKGLQLLKTIPEGELSMSEQNVLRRIESILTGTTSGTLKETDYTNMKKIASIRGAKLP